MSEDTKIQTGHVNESLLALLKVQEKDVKIRRLQKELDEKPRQSEALRAQLVDAKKSVEAAKETVKKILAEKNALEGDLESRIQNMRKYEAQSSQVKTNEEYRALLKEVETIKQGNKGLEDKILDAMEKVEEMKAAQSQAEQSLREEEKKVSVQEQEIQKEAEGIRSLLDGLLKEREELAVHVKPDLRERYELIFENKHDYAIVTIEHGACGGCHMAITPQVMNEVKRGHDLVICENCARVLCLPAQ